MFKVLGIALVVLALGIGVLPQFTDCLSQGQLTTLANGTQQPMKCHWSAQAEIAVAIPLAAVGVMMTTSRRKGVLTSLSVTGIVLGAMAIAIPAGLIGTCGMATHICNTAMKPAINVLGALAMAGSLGMMILSRKAND